MTEISEHEAMDEILKYLIKNKSDRPIHSETIWKEVYPDQNEEVVYVLLRKIMNTADDIVITHIRSNEPHNFEVFFESNAITKRFLEQQGGFTKQFENEQKEITEQNRLERLQNEKLESEVDIIRFQKGLGRKLTIWAVVLTAVSILVSFLTTLVQNQPYHDYDSKIDSLTQTVVKTSQKVDVLTDSLNTLKTDLRLLKEKYKTDTIATE
ncbi:hypothetical protein pgond44_14893 [Psychroflexus gondwanensis ACAM 44]|jgi:hypothetical protein|uniref:Uncharacterized protein n=1 Tax=Psychroflexus gondwanensis ACAM 44 TaxID=1189619 RepID=N1WRT1_9FLAO|nr:hypothetical protein [Psychroflexus gondwanensis]EMY79844.1 hypothetical protein pgond44_14893 [Psychroflexus gondwanensis ACAM 44]